MASQRRRIKVRDNLMSRERNPPATEKLLPFICISLQKSPDENIVAL
jgi:hypothetical protein